MNKILANCISLGIGLGAIGVSFPAQAASFQGLGDLPGGIFNSQAYGVSANGSVVVGRGNSANGFEASRWTQETGMVGVGNSPIMRYAWGVSADGSVVVGEGYNFIANGPEALRWTQQTGIVRLGDLSGGSFDSRAWGTSADGSVVVGVGNSANGLGDLSGGDFYSFAYGVSGDGSVVVGYSSSANGNEAFIWNSTQGMRSLKEVLTNDYGLNLTGWTLTGADGISADGLTVVGRGINPSGNSEAWIARLDAQNNQSVPEPSSILGLGLFSLVGFLIKKRS